MPDGVLLSVRPAWLRLMAEGTKVEDVRKSRPRLPTPFRCYLYCSLLGGVFAVDEHPANGLVIGEFVCDAVNEYSRNSRDVARLSGRSCVPATDLHHYFGRRATLYGWHITELTLYQRPRRLEEFGLRKAPQSWCYVKEAA